MIDLDESQNGATVTYMGTSMTVPIQVQSLSRDDLLRDLVAAIANKSVPPEECVGLYGWDAGPAEFYGVKWSYDKRLLICMAVIWHPNAIIPPAAVMAPEAIIYGIYANASR